MSSPFDSSHADYFTVMDHISVLPNFFYDYKVGDRANINGEEIIVMSEFGDTGRKFTCWSPYNKNSLVADVGKMIPFPSVSYWRNEIKKKLIGIKFILDMIAFSEDYVLVRIHINERPFAEYQVSDQTLESALAKLYVYIAYMLKWDESKRMFVSKFSDGDTIVQ